MKIIAYPNDDGTVSIVYPAEEFADQIDYIAKKDVPEGKPFVIMERDELPSFDTRDRWVWNNGKIEVIEKTKSVVQEVSRFQIKAALAEMGLLDQFLKVIESSEAIVKLSWEETTVIRFNSPIMNMILTSKEPNGLGLSMTNYVALFDLAASIENQL